MAAVTGDQIAAVLHGKNDIRLEETPVPQPGKGQVQIRVHSVGLCGTDFHAWQRGYFVTDEHPLVKPFIFGHESSGVVCAVGEGVTDLKVGDRVAIDPAPSCGECEFCTKGRSTLCPKLNLWEPGMGHLRQVIVHKAALCYKMPDTMTFEEGALLEPFVVAVYGCERGQVRVGTTVLIVGGGSIGMLSLVAAKAAGASKICVVDIRQSRIDFAKKMGATHTVLVEGSDTAATGKKIGEIMGDLPEVVLECSGTDPGMQTAIHAVKKGGKVVLVGVAPQMATIPAAMLFVKEADILCAFRYGNNFKNSLAAITAGVVDIKPIATHSLPLEKIVHAMEIASTGQDGALKVMVQPGKI